MLYLSGGPGDSALAEANNWIDYPIRQKRDIILLDQRGTGYSQPALNCPPLHTYDDVEACRAKLVSAGINLSAYNSAQSAADEPLEAAFEPLRKAHGVLLRWGSSSGHGRVRVLRT